MPESYLDRLLRGMERVKERSNSAGSATDTEALEPLRLSIERTLARVQAGVEPGASMFRYQVTGGKALIYQGTEALPLEPSRLFQLLNTVQLELQPGEVLDLDGTLASWVIRPEANLTESNLRQADSSIRILTQKTGRDRDHVAVQNAETTKVRLRGRLTQLVSALQLAKTDVPPELPDPGTTAAPSPKASAPPPPPPKPVAPPPPPPKPKEYPVTDAVLAEALPKVLAAISGSGFKAVGVGAVAHQAWGSAKPLQKIELMVSSTPSQRDTLLNALRSAGLQQLPDGRPLQLRYINEELGVAAPVELSEASTPPLKQIFARAQTGIVCDTDLEVTSCEDLILQCISPDTPADLEYGIELLRENLSLLDGPYLKKEAQSSGLIEPLKAAWQQAKERMDQANRQV